MRGQLSFWSVRIDLAAKLRAERDAGAQVFYHFRGVPLTMYSK